MPTTRASWRRTTTGAAPAGSDALSAALKLLSARGRSRLELDRLLERRGHPAEERSRAIDRVSQLGYLDDAKLAHARAASLLRDGRLAPAAVRRRLLALGLSDELVESAVRLAAGEQGFDPVVAARALLERRGLTSPSTARDRARAGRLLAARGFDEDVVEKVLGLGDDLSRDDGLDPSAGED